MPCHLDNNSDIMLPKIDDQPRVKPPRSGPGLKDGPPAPEAAEDKLMAPVRQEIKRLGHLLDRLPGLPQDIKQQYDLALHRLKRFIGDVKNGRDPAEAFQEHGPAARLHLRQAQSRAVKLLRQRARDVSAGYAGLKPALSAEEQKGLQSNIDTLTRLKAGKLSAAEAKKLNRALSELGQKLPPLVKQVRTRTREKLLRSLAEVRAPLKALLAADEQVGTEGRAAASPWFSGLAYQFAANPAFRQGTTLADRERATRDPAAARSVADLLLSLDQLTADVRSGRPLSPERLRDLQRIAQHPVIARTQSAVAAGSLIEAAKIVAVSSALITAGGFAGGLAGEAFAALAGEGALAGLGTLLTEGAAFTAITAPLEAAAGLDKLPAGMGEWAGRVAANTAMLGVFKVAAKAYQGIAAPLRLNLSALYELGKLGTSFAAMDGFALGEQLVNGEKGSDVFSLGNLGRQSLKALPMFIGLETAGRISRPLLSPVFERVSGWRARTRENTAVTRNENRNIQGPVPQGPEGPVTAEPELSFGSESEFTAFVRLAGGDLPEINARRTRLVNANPYGPAYLADARELAREVWKNMTPAERANARRWLGREKISADLLIGRADELVERESRNQRYGELLKIKVELFAMKDWAAGAGKQYGVKPEWMDRLILADHWFTEEVKNFRESNPAEKSRLIEITLGSSDSSRPIRRPVPDEAAGYQSGLGSIDKDGASQPVLSN